IIVYGEKESLEFFMIGDGLLFSRTGTTFIKLRDNRPNNLFNGSLLFFKVFFGGGFLVIFDPFDLIRDFIENNLLIAFRKLSSESLFIIDLRAETVKVVFKTGASFNLFFKFLILDLVLFSFLNHL